MLKIIFPTKLCITLSYDLLKFTISHQLWSELCAVKVFLNLPSYIGHTLQFMTLVGKGKIKNFSNMENFKKKIRLRGTNEGNH